MPVTCPPSSGVMRRAEVDLPDRLARRLASAVEIHQEPRRRHQREQRCPSVPAALSHSDRDSSGAFSTGTGGAPPQPTARCRQRAPGFRWRIAEQPPSRNCAASRSSACDDPRSVHVPSDAAAASRLLRVGAATAPSATAVSTGWRAALTIGGMAPPSRPLSVRSRPGAEADRRGGGGGGERRVRHSSWFG